jgi:hypothetical protein
LNGQQTDQCFEEGGFPRPIRSDYRDPRSVRNLERNILKGWRAIVTHGDILQLQSGRFYLDQGWPVFEKVIFLEDQAVSLLAT